MEQFVKDLSNAKHLQTEVDALKLGQNDAEVVFVGRSNVGKSSLINAVCRKKDMARVSKVPGKTRTINVYEVKFGRWIVDLPGYGFAVGSRSEREQLGGMIEAYFKSRENLRMIFVVIDSVAGPTKLDMLTIEWIKSYALPFKVLVNKIDKISPSRLEERKKEIAADLAVDMSDISWVSSQKDVGIKALQQTIASLLGI